MATVTITISDGDDGRTDVSFDFVPAAEKGKHTAAQSMGMRIASVLASSKGASEPIVDGDLDD